MPITLSIPALKKPLSYSAADAKAAGVSFEDVVRAASAMAIDNKDVERRLRLWMADCAAHVLHIYEKTGDSDAPRSAIIAARQFARGEIDAAAWAARDAAWAARDASSRAAWAAWAAWAARDASRAAWAAWDVAWAARDAAWAAWAAEEAWQYDRLIQWLSDEEPADWPLPEREGA